MNTLLHVSIPCPLRMSFDYLSDNSTTSWQAGLRVRISFGSRELIGIIIKTKEISKEEDVSRLKPILECLDLQPIIPNDLMSLTHWLSDYYHHPLGDCFQTVLPTKIRKGEPLELETETAWLLINPNPSFKAGKKQQQIIDLLQSHNEALLQRKLYSLLGNCRASLISLEEKEVIQQQQQIKQSSKSDLAEKNCTLNEEQNSAVDNVWSSHQKFTPFLLQGITGSGKTEVYMELTEKAVNEGKQVLILIPEIGLTTQFVTRFKQRLAVNIVILNSSISDNERKQSWLLAKEGLADVVIGTRSAVFSPLKNMGLIIIDEEHDASYKQYDGLRYHARNVALIRAKKAGIPIVLGSATPSLESLYHTQQGRYQRLELNKRATGAKLPKVHLIDSTGPKADNGISSILYKAIQKQLAADNQVLLFINRRGFAPVLMCHECNWQANCSHCDAKMIVHQSRNTLCCHHCGLIQRLPQQCPKCQDPNLNTYGAGTEQVELSLQRYFPDTPVLRIDRDSTQRVNAFADLVADIRQGGAKILVGTQMLAKGHDFHDVTLVGVLDADQGLLSADFRATENLAQLITQVTGRSGRGSKAGEVFIQTSQPQHEFWDDLIKQGYPYTADKLLKERALMAMPPVGSLCVIRAEDRQQQLAMLFLTEVLAILNQHGQQEVVVMGPVPAIMEKKAGRYRAQLLLLSPKRKPIHQLLDHYIDAISALKLARKVRWSIDIDPIDLM